MSERSLFVECPLCNSNHYAFAMDAHLQEGHGIGITSSNTNCAWCGAFLADMLVDSRSRLDVWAAHLSECSAYAAWLLSGAETWKYSEK